MIVVRPPYSIIDSLISTHGAVVEGVVGIIQIRHGWRVEAGNRLCETGQVRGTRSLRSGHATIVETTAVDGVDGIGISSGIISIDIGTAAVAASTIILPSWIRYQVAS